MAYCKTCKRSFSSITRLRQHYDDSPRHFYCDWCDEHFESNELLNEHYEDDHESCDSCDIIFESDDGLHDHRTEEHADRYCEECRRLFMSANNLRHHLTKTELHNGRQHPCPSSDCDRWFITRADVILHLESGACPSEYDRFDLERFVRSSQHGEEVLADDVDGSSDVSTSDYEAVSNGRKFRCDHCHTTFRTRQAVKAHLQSPVHAPEVYECPEQYDGCGTRFRTLSSLFQHVYDGRCDIDDYEDIFDSLMTDLQYAIY